MSQLPKTPSVLAKGRKRTRQKKGAEAIVEEEECTPSKIVPIKLHFDDEGYDCHFVFISVANLEFNKFCFNFAIY